MAALSATTPTNIGATATGAAVAASDTIARSVMGATGAYLEIINGSGSTDTITITDHGQTAAGNQLTSNLVTGINTVAAGASRVYYIRQSQVNPSTNLVTVTHSQTTSVTYKLFPA